MVSSFVSNITTEGVAVTATTTPFVLRLPPEMKAAAAALTNASAQLGPELLGGHATTAGPASINATLNYLLLEGAYPIRDRLRTTLTRLRAVREAGGQAVRFLLDNPNAQRVCASDLPEGSTARQLVSNCAATQQAYDGVLDPQDALDGHNNSAPDDVACWPRADAVSFYASAQAQLSAAETALSALVAALESVSERG